MPRRVVLMLAGSAAFVLLHAAWIGLRIGGTQVAGFADGIALVVASTVAPALTAVGWRRTSERWQRRGWLVLSLSCASFELGVLGAIVFYALWNRLPTGASVLDVPWLGNSALVAVAVLLLGGRMLGRSRVRLLLDGGIVACAVLLVSWLTTLHAVYRTGA